MNKAFTRENEDEEDDGDAPENASPLPAGSNVAACWLYDRSR